MKNFQLPIWVLLVLVLTLVSLVILFSNQTATDRLLTTSGLSKVLYPDGKESPPPPPAQSTETALPLPGTADNDSDVVVSPVTSSANIPEVQVLAKPNTYRLYFLKLSPEGRMEPVAFLRELPAGTTPLAATLKALLQGPTLQDKAQGALNLIPNGTRLLSIRIKEKTALISLSEEFCHNGSGLEGLAGQLREIVWTATQFPTIDSVRFLINGQYRDTLGEGGITISTPFTRSTVP